jgi:hypothetical protein
VWVLIPVLLIVFSVENLCWVILLCDLILVVMAE